MTTQATALPLGCSGGAAHCTVLTWTVGTQPNGVVVSGFNIYKSSTSGKYGAPFATITDPTKLSFEDDAPAAAGIPTFYSVSVLCSSCGGVKESALSNEVTATVPFPTPVPPSNVGATSQ